MSSARPFRFFAVLPVLALSLSFALAPRAFADVEIVILIDDFESLPGTGDKDNSLAKSGPTMLMSALSDLLDDDPNMQLKMKFVERDKLNAILEEKKLPTSLPNNFKNPKVIKQLKLLGAEYLALSRYEDKRGITRVDTRIVKLEGAFGEISRRKTFASGAYLTKEEDPFPYLAGDLVDALLVANKLPARRKALRLVPAGFKLEGEPVQPNRAQILKGLVRDFLSNLLAEQKPKSLDVDPAVMTEDDEAKAVASLFEKEEIVLVLHVTIRVLSGNDMRMMISGALFHKDRGRMTGEIVQCTLQMLENNERTAIHSLLTKLGPFLEEAVRRAGGAG